MNYLMIGAMSGCIVVIMGAFGAHALNEILDDYGKSIYNKAVLYHMFHSIALLILGLINKIQPEISLSISFHAVAIPIPPCPMVLLFLGAPYLLFIPVGNIIPSPIR